MKKILLIPTLLATNVAPLSCLASLTSCGKKQHDDAKDYLTFEALEDGQLSCDIKIESGTPEINLDVQYSLNNGKWTTLEINEGDEHTNYLSYKTGDNIHLKGVNDYWSCRNDIYYYASSLHFTGLVNASGNIMSLLYGDDFDGKKTIPCNGCFESIFNGYISPESNFVQIFDAKNLILPTTTLAAYCYDCMFYDCDKLTNAPELPATTLADSCYREMFKDCDSLIAAPALPAETLADWCYAGMFENCDALINAPELPAETLATSCYTWMFRDCDKLVNAPALPAETLAYRCYFCMFQDCDTLTHAPNLPADTLTEACYNSMFTNCTSLTVKIEGDLDKLIFTSPDVDISFLDVCAHDMFWGTKGDYIPQVQPKVSYYWAEE